MGIIDYLNIILLIVLIVYCYNQLKLTKTNKQLFEIEDNIEKINHYKFLNFHIIQNWRDWHKRNNSTTQFLENPVVMSDKDTKEYDKQLDEDLIILLNKLN